MKSANVRLTKLTTILDATTSNTVTEHLKVKHCDHIMFQLGTVATTDGTLKVRSSINKTADLTVAQSITNIWDYKYIYNLNSATGIAGSTGVTPAGEVFAEYRVNVDGAYFMSWEVTSQTAGTYTVKAYGINKFGT